MADLDAELQKRIVHVLPGMARVRVKRDIPYKTVEGLTLAYDVYYPPDFAEGEARACVIFVHGEGPAEILKQAKDWGQYVSWGLLTAASGLVAVTFNHRSSDWFTRLHEVAGDVDELIAAVRANAASLGIAADRMGIWVCSGGAPVGLRAALRKSRAFVKCAVVYYGRTNLEMMRDRIGPEASDELLREFSPELLLQRMEAADVPPLLIARGGADDLPLVNDSLDRFVALALAKNIALDFMNHPAGVHGFDVWNDDERSREIIARTVDFLKASLGR